MLPAIAPNLCGVLLLMSRPLLALRRSWEQPGIIALETSLASAVVAMQSLHHEALQFSSKAPCLPCNFRRLPYLPCPLYLRAASLSHASQASRPT